MTITANPVRNQYIAAPNQTVFNYTYKIYSDNDLSVYVTPAGQAPDDSADLITSYTVDPGTIGNQSGGFITLDTGANSGDIITIASAIQYDRETDYQTNGDFSPETVNGDFDRVVSLVKQNKGLINRAVLAPASGSVNDDPISLPSPEDEKALKWESGNLSNSAFVEEVKTDTEAISLVSTSGNTVTVKGLKQGPSILLTDEGDDVRIDALSPAGGNVRTDFDNTYNPGTTQNFDGATANTMSIGGVDVTTKNAAQDSATASAASAASTADGKAVAAQSTANTANSKANTNESSINTINARPYVIDQGGSGNKRYRKWSDGRVEAWGTNQAISTTNGVVITLPTTFPSSNYSLLTTYDSNTGGDAAPMIIGGRTTTQFVLSRGQTGLTCSFYAISI